MTLARVASCAALQPFTKGNVLVVKRAEIATGDCVEAALVEVTVDGQIVQEFPLPTNTSEPNACLVWKSDYNSRLNVATDGVRAILPCCTNRMDPELSETRNMISFGIIYGNGHFETTPALFGDESTYPITSVLDGEDIWFTVSQKVLYTNVIRDYATVIFDGDVFSLRSVGGNLYASNYEGLSDAIVQIGNGLPKEITTSVTPLLEGSHMVNHFEIVDNLLGVGFFPDGFSLFSGNGTVLINEIPTNFEISHFTFVPGQEKAICAIRDALIISIDLAANKFGNVTVLLSPTEDGQFYYSPCMVPENNCANEKKDLDETDVDCGGMYCSKCADNKACKLDNDCTSGTCADSICQPLLVPEAPTTSTDPSAPVSDSDVTPGKAPTGKTSSATTFTYQFGSVFLLAWIAM